MAEIDSILYQIIGKRITELRKLSNDNQQQLAGKIGLKRSTISNIEAGRQQISLHILYRIAQVYNAEIYSLIPKVTELASKVSLEINDLTELLDQHQLGDNTRKQIMELLKKV